jgi:hypothetical protein
MSNNLNKVNMSLDDIINNQRRNKRNLQIVKSDRPSNFNRKNGNNDFRRRNFNRGKFFRNENDGRDNVRVFRGKDANIRTRGRMRRNDNLNRNYFRRNENFDNNRAHDNQVGI